MNMSEDNPISTAVQWYKEHGPNPVATAGLLGLMAWGASKLGWNPLVETSRSLLRPIGTRMLGGGPAANAQYNEAFDNLKNDSEMAKWLPRVIGMLGFMVPMELWDTPGARYRGWTQWDAPVAAHKLPDAMLKKGSFGPMYNPTQDIGLDSYVTQLDWNRRIPASDVVGLFKYDPHLADETYARNMGISIVADAAMNQQTRKPTLGGIFDSAVNKIENKLTFGGVANVALKTAVANGVSRLFASSVGAMMDLSPQARQNLVDAGTWAGAVTAMLK